MDDLVAALHLLAQKLRVDVGEMAGRYVLYTQITAVVVCLVYLICAYVTYRVINYVYEEYVTGNPMKIFEAGLPEKRTAQYNYEKPRLDAIAATHAAGAKIARIVLMALIMGSFFISAALQLPSAIFPRGAALDSVMESLADATKVEIVRPEERTRREQPKKEKTESKPIEKKGK